MDAFQTKRDLRTCEECKYNDVCAGLEEIGISRDKASECHAYRKLTIFDHMSKFLRKIFKRKERK